MGGHGNDYTLVRGPQNRKNLGPLVYVIRRSILSPLVKCVFLFFFFFFFFFFFLFFFFFFFFLINNIPSVLFLCLFVYYLPGKNFPKDIVLSGVCDFALLFSFIYSLCDRRKHIVFSCVCDFYAHGRESFLSILSSAQSVILFYFFFYPHRMKFP